MSEPEPTRGPDSLVVVATALSRSARAQRAMLWLFGVLAVVAGWVAAKIDTRLDIKREVGEQLEQRAALDLQRHTQVIGAIEKLDDKLLSQDVNEPGKVILIEKGVWLAFRAIAEVRAIALTAEPARTRAAKEAQGARWARSFDGRAARGPPQAIYAELVDQVAVP